VRAKALDQRVRNHLAKSLTAIVRAAEGRLEFEREALEQLIAAVRARPVRPAVMAIYSDLVEAIFSEDEPRTMSLLSELSQPVWRDPCAPRIVNLADDELGPHQGDRYRRLLNDDPSIRFDLAPVPSGACPEARGNFAQAQHLIGAALPELAGELDYLAREVVLVDAGAASSLSVHGASCFYLWGAVVLNRQAHGSRLKIVEGLAHESGHALLLGITLGAPLVENPVEERYPSPLRDDPRPMDGLVHATYVLARMHYAVSRVAASGLLDRNELDDARAVTASALQSYREALSVVDRSARFTTLGGVAFEGARQYMSAMVH
jgi:hypothetical protein